MIDKAGKDFSDPKILCAFEKFKEMVILPLTSEVGLAPNRFVYTMGNHEIDRSAVGGDDKDQEITDRLKNHEDVDRYIHNDGKDQSRIAEYNRLRDKKERKEGCYSLCFSRNAKAELSQAPLFHLTLNLIL